LFAKQSDIDKHAIERAEKSNRIGAILERARRPYGIRRFIELRERGGLREVLELLVLETATGEFLLTPTQRRAEPWADAIDRVHGAGIIDVVGANKLSIERAGQRCMQQLVNKTRIILLPIPEKDPVHPEILRARVGVEVFPFGILRVFGRFHRTRTDVTEGARHTHPVRAD